jgi:hypothetical protein
MAVAAVAAVISPVVVERDSFPLSTYPMYADRGTRVATIATAEGVDVSGAVHRLSLGTIAGTDDPLVAESLIESVIRVGRAQVFCAEIAHRADRLLVRIEVVEERHDLVARAEHKKSLIERRVDASCQAPR